MLRPNVACFDILLAVVIAQQWFKIINLKIFVHLKIFIIALS